MLSEISTFEPPAEVVLPVFPPPLPEEPIEQLAWSVPRSRERLTAGGASFLLHLLLIILLAFFFSIPLEESPSEVDLVISVPNVIEGEITESGEAILQSSSEGGSHTTELVGMPVEVTIQSQNPVVWQPEPAASPEVEQQVEVARLVESKNWLTPSGAVTGGGIEGRSTGMKGKLLATRGGSQKSEVAVARGLRWLAAHQKKIGRASCRERV